MTDWNNHEDIWRYSMIFPLAELFLSFLRGVDRFSVALATGALCVFLPVVRHLTRSKIWKLCLALISEMWMLFFASDVSPKKMSSKLCPWPWASETPLTSHNFGWKENALRELLWNWNVFCYSTNMHVIISVEPSRCVARGPKEQVPSDLLLPNQSISKGLWHLVAFFPYFCHTFGIYSSLTCFKSNGSKFGQAMGLEPPAPLVTSLGS